LDRPFPSLLPPANPGYSLNRDSSPHVLARSDYGLPYIRFRHEGVASALTGDKPAYFFTPTAFVLSAWRAASIRGRYFSRTSATAVSNSSSVGILPASIRRCASLRRSDGLILCSGWLAGFVIWHLEVDIPLWFAFVANAYRILFGWIVGSGLV
jgi:hypothetical protein